MQRIMKLLSPGNISRILPKFPGVLLTRGLHQTQIALNSTNLNVKVESKFLQFNFDPTIYLKMLQDEGFTEVEANCLVGLISEVINESIVNSTKSLVTKEEQERFILEFAKGFEKVRKNVNSLEKVDFDTFRSNIQEIKAKIEETKDNSATDFERVLAGARLDMNLDKQRVVTEADDLAKDLLAAEIKIDAEINKLEQRMQKIKDQTINGVVQFIATLAILLIMYRVLTLKKNSKNQENRNSKEEASVE